ncbi:MAG TPA: MFS transporter [Acidimicrobiales bacterium]|jgi:MFS family permease|nr:MFS transporter [Acidimicrobiales bacterium]
MSAVPLRRNRDFVLLQTGQLLSSAGTQATAIAYPLLALALTHSAVKAGLVSFARTAPIALLAIPAGLAADRWNRRALMIGADALRAAAMAGLALSLVVGDIPFWVLPCVAFVEGIGTTIFNAAEPGALRAVVPTEQLPEAAGAQSGRTAAVRIVGPPLGGALFEAGRALPFVLDACSYACSTVSLLFMHAQFQEDRQEETGSFRQRAADGLSFMWHQPFLRTTAFLYGLLNFTAFGLLFCIVVIGESEGLSGGVIGLLTGVFAASVVVGSILSPTVRRGLSVHAVLILEVWAWLGCAVFLAWPHAVVLAVGLVPVGLAVPSTDSVVNGYRIAVTPDRLLGRSESVRSAIALSAGSIAPLIAGFLLQHSTPRWTVACFTAWALGLALWATTSQALREPPPPVPRPAAA